MIDYKKLYDGQLKVWDDFRNRVSQLDTVELRKFDMGTYSIYAQYNPARAVSSGAKLDAKTIANRKCFLCECNRPAIQEGIQLDEKFTLLVNPFPILKGHMTIPIKDHEEQQILPHIGSFITFCKELPSHTLLYNGPKCGASAPDHMHFQAVLKGQLPFEEELKTVEVRILSENKEGTMEEFLNYGRKCIHIKSTKATLTQSYFEQLYKQLQMLAGTDDEPLMNLFGFYEGSEWHLFVFPRKKHRPTQFFEEGEKYKMISPGAIDVAGILVLPRRNDFDELTKDVIEDVFSQVCY